MWMAHVYHPQHWKSMRTKVRWDLGKMKLSSLLLSVSDSCWSMSLPIILFHWPQKLARDTLLINCPWPVSTSVLLSRFLGLGKNQFLALVASLLVLVPEAFLPRTFLGHQITVPLFHLAFIGHLPQGGKWPWKSSNPALLKCPCACEPPGDLVKVQLLMQ